MADRLIQKTEDGGQRTEVLSRRSRAFNQNSSFEMNSPFPLSGERLGWGLMLWKSHVSTPSLMELLASRAEKRSAFRRMHPIRRITLRSSALLAAFCLLPSAFCYAEELPDPTRPPASIAAPVAAVGVEAAPAGLQSIIISKTRRAAIIDGETVELGGKHGDAKLVKVNEGSVVLKGAQGRQVLTLFPDVKLVSKKEVKTKPQPAATKVQAGKQEAKPVAHYEKLLSGHPKEKK